MDLELDLEPLRSFIAQRIGEAEESVQLGKVAKTDCGYQKGIS